MQCYTKPLDSLKNWNNRFFWVDEKVFPTVVNWRISAPKDGMPVEGTHSMKDVVLLNTRRTPIQKQPELLLCLVGLSRRYFLRDDVGNCDGANKGRRKKDKSETEASAPPKVLRIDHASVRPGPNTHGGKSLAAIGLGACFTVPTPTPQKTPVDVIEPDPLSYARPQSVPEQDIARSSKGAVVAGDTDSEKSTSFTSLAGSPNGIYQPGWGVTNNCRLDTPEACQDMVDHSVLPGYFSELRHLSNLEFLGQYNMNLARQVPMGSQLRFRFEQEVRLRRKTMSMITRRNQKIQVRKEEIKKLDEEVKSFRVVETEVHGLRNQTQNLETLLEAEVDMKKAVEAKNADLVGELESEEKIKASFEEFKKLKDEKVERRCAKIDARLDALSIDFDEELYPHMLKAIAGCRWVIGHDFRLAVMKCAESVELRQGFTDVVSAGIAKGMSEGLKHGEEHGKA
ncbi:hypothetical protein Tco_0868862 [Tanacetum coccineum]